MERERGFVWSQWYFSPLFSQRIPDRLNQTGSEGKRGGGVGVAIRKSIHRAK